MQRFGDRTEVLIGQHHWPTWGRDNIVEYLSLQRDLYAYLHDQTLRMINQGYTGTEIAELIETPPALAQQWHTHGYYGSVSHNVKAIYVYYLGWFDANPANLNPLTPVETAKKTVEYGGTGATDPVQARVNLGAPGRRLVNLPAISAGSTIVARTISGP